MDLGEVAGLGPLGVKITDDPLELFAGIDAALDFTSPKATVEFAALAANARIVHVIGTTGLDADDEAAIAAAARHATIVRSGNMSLGVNLLAALTRRGAGARRGLRHRDRRDAPSPQGRRALRDGADARRGGGGGPRRSAADHSVRVRDGAVGPRRKGDIGLRRCAAATSSASTR